MISNKANTHRLRIEIDRDCLLTVISGFGLSASDIRCLDLESKLQMQHIFLQSCAGKPAKIEK